MIRVERPHPGPAALIDPQGAGEIETAAAKAFYAIRKNRDATYEFKVYKDAQVRAMLEAMFHGKCAYCESRYPAVHPVEIEHFRPKGAVVVDGKMVKPGYYWLAASWTNLLPSCIDCNRKREQELQDATRAMVGKANLFPIASEAKRAKKPGDEKKEKPLILDPCADEPSEHLRFTEEGHIVPRTKSGRVSKRGEASITVFGLSRIGLVQERAVCAKVIEKNIATARRQKNALARNPNDPDIQLEFDEAVKSLREAAHPQSRYSAMARQLVEEPLRELGFPL